MGTELLEVSMADIKRAYVLRDWVKGRINGFQASMLMGVSYRHALRLRKRFEREGLKGIRRRKRGRKGISKEVEREVCRLYEEVYGRRLNIMHFKDKLEEVHGITLSYEKIRQILIKAGLHEVRKRRRKFHKRRQRMPKRGMLEQMDTSEHEWIEGLGRWCLIGIVDDASGEILHAEFKERDTTFANMEVIRKVIEKYGIFHALYVDRASHFKTTRRGGLHYDVGEEQGDTNIEKALSELGITLIPAYSPQAKGRIERVFRTFQDRLRNELWIRGIRDYDEANRFLQKEFIPWYNERFALRVEESVFKPVPEGIDLDLVFTKRAQRRVNKDNTISFYGQKIQLLPSKMKLNFLKAKVEIRWSSTGKYWILYKGKVILKGKLPKNHKLLKKEEEIETILSKRSYY